MIIKAFGNNTKKDSQLHLYTMVNPCDNVCNINKNVTKMYCEKVIFIIEMLWACSDIGLRPRNCVRGLLLDILIHVITGS